MNTTPFTHNQRIIFLVAISLATLLIVLDYSIANVAIPYIAGGLAVSIDEGIYVITFFSIGNAIGLAMTGWLTRRYGQVRLIILSIALFTLLSWFCGLAPNLLTLVIARFLQGLVSGPTIPLSQSILLRFSSPEHQVTDLSIWSMIVITGPILGPLLGGYISYWYTWSWIFYINIPLGIACCVIFWFLLRDRETEREKVPGDIPGILLLCIAVSCFQLFLDKGQQWDWWNSNAIRATFICFIVSTVFFLLRELSSSQPFFYLRLFKIPSFSTAIIALFVSYGIYFGSIVLVPLWLQEYMGYTAVWAGIAVCFFGIGPVLLLSVSPKLIRRIGNILTLCLSFVIFWAATFYTSFFFTDIDIQHIAFSRAFMGLGFICYITPLIQISIKDIAKSDLPSATGIFHFFRSLSGAVGASVISTLWERRTIFHHERLGSALTRFNPFTPEATDLSTLQQLENSLTQQAAMLAFNDTFYFMSWLFMSLIILMLGFYFWQKRKIECRSRAFEP